MQFSQATLEGLNRFVEQQKKDLKETTEKLNFWERQTTILAVKLDQARENFRSFERKEAIIQGSLTISKIILEAEKNGE